MDGVGIRSSQERQRSVRLFVIFERALAEGDRTVLCYWRTSTLASGAKTDRS